MPKLSCPKGQNKINKQYVYQIFIIMLFDVK